MGVGKGKVGGGGKDLVKGTGESSIRRASERERNTRKQRKGGGTAPGNNPGVETPGDRKSKTGEGKEGGRRRHAASDWLPLLGSRYVPSPNRGSSPQDRRNTTDADSRKMNETEKKKKIDEINGKKQQ